MTIHLASPEPRHGRQAGRQDGRQADGESQPADPHVTNEVVVRGGGGGLSGQQTAV